MDWTFGLYNNTPTNDWLFLKALAIGFMMAAPVGPVGVLCVRRSLAFGVFVGLASGLGATCADAMYGAVAAFGLTAISDFISEYQFYIRLFGGLLMLWLGFRLYRAPHVDQQNGVCDQPSHLGSFVSAFLLTASNPATVIGFGITFAALGMAGLQQDYALAGQLVLGVFTGSALWWLTLCIAMATCRHLIHLDKVSILSRFAGIAIILFGLVALISAFSLQFEFMEGVLPWLEE